MQAGVKRGLGTDGPIQPQHFKMVRLAQPPLENGVEGVTGIDRVRHGEDIHQALPGFVDPVRRDDVTGEWL